MKRFEINLGKIVIGSSLEAVLYAFYKKYKLISTRQLEPTEFDNFEDFGLGADASDIWKKHMFLLSIAGYTPFSNKIKHIRYVDCNTIKIITTDESVAIIKYDKLYIFDDYNFLDLPLLPSKTTNKTRIVDWFYVERGSIHEHNFIKNKNNFMNQVYFFKNSVKKTAKRKDVCVVTLCNKKNINKYPEHLIRIKTEKLMRELGIETATQHKTHIKIDHRQRDIVDLDKNIYENFDNVEFIYEDAKFIYELNKKYQKIDYMKYLSMKLGV